MSHLKPALWFLLCAASPVFAAVDITAPANNAEVVSPFTLSAVADSCSSQWVKAMFYSVDNGSQLSSAASGVLQEKVSLGLGPHTLHVTALGENGSVCVSDAKVNVTRETSVRDDASPEGISADSVSSSVPAEAKSNGSIQTHSGWREVHDAATRGRTRGSTGLVSSPSHSGTARRFETHFTDSGGERYSDSFGEDTRSTHFVYDGWVYIPESAKKVLNIEMDVNQVLENGHVMIYAFQCAGSSGTWDYGINAGSIEHHSARWVHTRFACNPREWAVNKWHHVQIAYSREGSDVFYKSITFDGKEHSIRKKVLGEFGLHWGHVIQTNFQIEGVGSGANEVLLDDLVVYRW